MVAADCSGGSWLWLMMVDHGGSWSLMLPSSLSDILLYVRTDFSHQCCCIVILFMCSATRGNYCTSIGPGRGISHMWLHGLFLPCYSGFSFGSSSLLLLWVTDRGCHICLSPMKQIWLICLKMFSKLSNFFKPWFKSMIYHYGWVSEV